MSSLFRSWRWCMIIGFLLRKRFFFCCFFRVSGFPDWFSSTKHKVCSTARSTSRTMKHKVRVETRTMFVPANTETPMVGLRLIFCHYVFSETLFWKLAVVKHQVSARCLFQLKGWTPKMGTWRVGRIANHSHSKRYPLVDKHRPWQSSGLED